MPRSYHQNCPIAKGLDVLGERWTLLILRELIGGPRRYGDLRAQLPGIATNLLADRLRELEDAGLVDREELPPPIARTVYTLSETGLAQGAAGGEGDRDIRARHGRAGRQRADAVERISRGHPVGLRSREGRRPGRLVPHRDR